MRKQVSSVNFPAAQCERELKIPQIPQEYSLRITKAWVPAGLNLWEWGAFNMRHGSIQYSQLYYARVSLKTGQTPQCKPGNNRKLEGQDGICTF